TVFINPPRNCSGVVTSDDLTWPKVAGANQRMIPMTRHKTNPFTDALIKMSSLINRDISR
ncbi:MAG TPA: hypothetical protein DEO84_02360, partial [candidate division Zixibacteria bacterium]|nr:hypothetical protein [candidate division Zixibacteria bacterium]